MQTFLIWIIICIESVFVFSLLNSYFYSWHVSKHTMFTRVSTWKGFQQSFSSFIVDVISAAEIALCRFSLFHKDFRFNLLLKNVLYSIASQSIVYFIISLDFLSFFSFTHINILAFFFKFFDRSWNILFIF